MRNIAKARQLLKEVDEKYNTDPEVSKRVAEYRRKYATLKEKSLLKTFTI